jgi:hypothetical protein
VLDPQQNLNKSSSTPHSWRSGNSMGFSDAAPTMAPNRSVEDPETTPTGGRCGRHPAVDAVDNVLELLRPGSFVRLRNHPLDLPPFQLIRCQGGRCWVRQQAWGQLVAWEVPHRRLTSVRPGWGGSAGPDR